MKTLIKIAFLTLKIICRNKPMQDMSHLFHRQSNVFKFPFDESYFVLQIIFSASKIKTITNRSKLELSL